MQRHMQLTFILFFINKRNFPSQHMIALIRKIDIRCSSDQLFLLPRFTKKASSNLPFHSGK